MRLARWQVALRGMTKQTGGQRFAPDGALHALSSALTTAPVGAEKSRLTFNSWLTLQIFNVNSNHLCCSVERGGTGSKLSFFCFISQ